jgi:Mg/Co/Ni transporter MgtE
MYVNPLGASKKRSSDTHIGIAPAPHHHSLSALPASDQPVAAFEAPYGSAPVLRVLRDRFGVLASLLVLQSLSSIVLQRYEQLLEHHIEITLFLTMVVGAGGNASNQSAVDVIRGLATGAIRPWSSSTSSGETMGLFSVLKRELHIGLMLALALFVITFIRVFVAVQVFFFCFVDWIH